VTLIQRTTRKLNITPAGKVYYAKCLAGMNEINAAELAVLPTIILSYMKAFPKVSVEIILTVRRVDLAIRAGELQDSCMIVKKNRNCQLCSRCFSGIS
jgi:DNA-binding transcriptional LysR family regulator